MFRGRSNNPRSLRTIGVDDGAFALSRRGSGRQHAPIAAVFFEGLTLVDVRLSSITVDGNDATRVISRLLSGKRADLALLSGVTFGGFNVADPWKIHREHGVPIAIVTGDRPRNRAVKAALMKHFSDWANRWEVFERLPTVHSARTKTDEPPLYFEAVGVPLKRTKAILKALSLNSRLPEPIRVAGLITRGVGPVA
jgi:endonuclease V-like protein UPF0215 family